MLKGLKLLENRVGASKPSNLSYQVLESPGIFLPCNNGICVHSYWCTHLISWTKDVHKTRCTLCLKDIDLSSLRESL